MFWWAWAFLGVACMIVEVHVTHDFTLFCVGVAAFGLMALAGIAPSLPFWTHWLIFSALAVTVLLTVRKPLLGRFQSPRGSDADLNYLVGEVATVSEDLPARAFGHAELRGSVWTVCNHDSKPVSKGQRCRVTRVDGLTLWVESEQAGD